MGFGISRREFLKRSAVVASGTTSVAIATSRAAATSAAGAFKGKLCFFSKPLPELDWRTLARSAKRVGFDAIDLTVRKGGHVAPERAAEDLPKAVAAIREEGLDVAMITTALTSADDPTARPILSTAAQHGVKFAKPGYYQYEFKDVRRELENAGHEFRRLVELAKECGVQLGYHNHEEYVGEAVWDMASVIEPLDPKWVGYYFDPRHAVAEGGVGGWKVALNLVAARLKMLAVKDFYWEKTSKGWLDVNCPLGEGMVDWKYVFARLAEANFHGPISLHMEYQVAGATQAEKEENILATVKRDLDFLKARVREAYA